MESYMKFSKYIVLVALAGFVAQPAMAADKQDPGQAGPAAPSSDKQEPKQGGVGMPDDGQGGVGIYVPADKFH